MVWIILGRDNGDTFQGTFCSKPGLQFAAERNEIMTDLKSSITPLPARLRGSYHRSRRLLIGIRLPMFCFSTPDKGEYPMKSLSSMSNPLDFVPDEIPFDVPYGLPISLDQALAVIHAAVAEARNRNWKMNVAVADSGGNLVAFQRMDGAMLASIQIAEHKARAAATFRRETKVFEDGIQLMHLNYLLAFDGIIASRGGIPLIEGGKIIGAIGCSGGTDSQDEVVSNAGAAGINRLPATNK